MDEELKRDFYLQMACIEKWSVRTLREKGSMLFERTALSKHPEEVIKYELQKLAETQQLTLNLENPQTLKSLHPSLHPVPFSLNMRRLFSLGDL